MLAKAVDAIPDGAGWLFEPKWDGFRAHRLPRRRRGLHPEPRPQAARPLLPRAGRAAATSLPERCVLDGEIVIAGPGGLDFEALLLRIHPAASRVACWPSQTPASFVAWDLLALDDRDLRADAAGRPPRRAGDGARRGRAAGPPDARRPATMALAQDWFERFEGAGLDGVVAKPDRRRISRASARCSRSSTSAPPTAPWPASAGTRAGEGDRRLAAARPLRRRRHAAPRRRDLLLHDGEAARAGDRAGAAARGRDGRPPVVRVGRLGGRDGAQAASESRVRRAAGTAASDLSWEPLRVERVCEVAYDHLQGSRFRHGTTFLRWRPDRRPESCRYDQLEATAPFELERIFGAQRET